MLRQYCLASGHATGIPAPKRQRRGCGTPHDIDEALYLSDRVLLLGPGTLDSFAVPAARPRVRGTSDAASAAVKRALLEQLQAAHAF
jgi:hypothetical protein